MVETSKQVRVDNWGIYFLQRLQLFFSKTDYCDLTLQFEGNVQLKVHRLVMNACTEYFAFLEQSCPALEENTIMMPTDLQADVIVPIVNFMYTGMLEFHPSIFDKLYKAAETMNIAVLTKLLEAQLHSVSRYKPKKETSNIWAAKKPQKPLPLANELPPQVPIRKVSAWRKRQPAQPVAHPVSATFSNTKWNTDPPEKDPLMIMDNTPKPTRFEWPDDDQPPFSIDPSFDDVSLTSKPLWTKEDDQKAAPSSEEGRSKTNSISQEVEDEFSQKEQKVNIIQLDDCENSLKRKAENKVTSSPKRVKITNNDDETIISIKTNNPNDLDHTKIVSEILRKYPDLVKKKKNIKLKITSAKNDPPQVKVQAIREKPKPQPASPVEKPAQQLPNKKEIKTEPMAQKEPGFVNSLGKRSRSKPEYRAASDEGPWTCMECLGKSSGDGEAPEFVLYYLFRKHMTDTHQMEFDSCLCKYCGKKCSTDKSMAYHLYTKHGLRPPNNIKFPKCMSCPFIGVSMEKIQEHMKTHGKNEAQCVNCKLGFLSQKELQAHQQLTGHQNQRGKALAILDCAYCMKKLQSPVSLFTHIRTQHLKEAKRDGMTSLDEKMDVEDEDDAGRTIIEKEKVPVSPEKEEEIVINRVEEKQQQLLKERVKIISNVKVATRQEENSCENVADNTLEQTATPEPEPVAVTTTAAALSNIGGSLATNLGLVDIVVLDDNQPYILQQPQGQSGNAEFILPELTGNEGILQAATAGADINSTDELVMVLTDHDYQDDQNQGQSDNSNIVVLYSHPVEGQQGQFITSQGNLLVNSQGMIEIRNGAGITTTAGQILVNSENTTTTQSTVSPIESIELIRKEIEGEIVEQEGERNNIKDVLRKKVLEKDFHKIEKEVIAEESNQNIQNNIDHLENSTSERNDLLDTTDSSIQEEPMEVDEIGPQQSENLEQSHKEVEKQTVNNLINDEETEVLNPVTDETNQAETGQDIPPDFTTKIALENSESSVKLNTSSEEVILNDTSEFHELLEHETQNREQNAEVELMEVDSGNDNKQNEEGERDEVDNNESKSENPPDSDNQIQKQDQVLSAYVHQVESENLPKQDSSQINKELNRENNQVASIEVDTEPLMENDQIPDRKSDQEASTEKDQDSTIDNTAQSCSKNYQENNLEASLVSEQQESNIIGEHKVSTENDQIPILEKDQDNNQEPTSENDHVDSVESEQNRDNDHNDQNDNIQPNFDEFTDESQQSSNQKMHRDLNKEILDDWDDTDSQQSHSQDQDSQEAVNQDQDNQEDVQDQATLNAVENVNKLMDDWDEEDEDQSK